MCIVCGEVEAKVWYTESTKIYYYQENLVETGEKETKFQIKFNNFQINLYKTLSNFEIYDTIYTEQNLKIFSDFYLPICIVKVINKEQQIEKKNYSLEEAIDLGVEQLTASIESQIEDTANILRNNIRNR